MHLDVVDLRDFYASPVGQMVARHLSPVIRALVRTDAGTRVLGFGFPTPYLGAIDTAERVLAFMPAGQGVIDWPSGGASGSATALVEEDSLPLPDSSIDLVILVHALEMSDRPNALMAELRRVLTERRPAHHRGAEPAGPVGDAPTFRLSASAGPIRAGSSAQLFAEVGFEAETWTTALHMAPAAWRPLLGAARALDRIGRLVLAGFRRGDRGLGGEAHRAGDHGRARPRLSPRCAGARPPPAREVSRPQDVGDVRHAEQAYRRESRKIAWSARKFHSVRRSERFRTRPLP